jgi:hypothetical protein
MTSCIFQLDKSRISTFNLIDCDASDYAFINKKFAQIHEILLRFFKYARRLENFNDQSILTKNIIHVIEVIMNLNEHVKKLFFFVIELKNFFIILSHLWLRRHQAIVNFDFNIIFLMLFFCLIYCNSHLVKIIIYLEEKFLFSAKSQKV